jgi:hypothetical protein
MSSLFDGARMNHMEVTVAQGTLAATMRQSDDRMQIKELADLDLSQTVTHAFYFRYLLPIWFGIQVIEFKPGFAPEHRWRYG